MNKEALFSVNDPAQLRLHFDKIRPALTIVRQRREAVQSGACERSPYDWLMQDFHGHPEKEDNKEVRFPDQPDGKTFPFRYLAKYSLGGLIAIVRTTEPGAPVKPENTMVIIADLPEKTVIPWTVARIADSRAYKGAQEYSLALPSRSPCEESALPDIGRPLDALEIVTDAWRHRQVLNEESAREPHLVIGPGYKAIHKPGGGSEQLIGDLVHLHLGIRMYYQAEELSKHKEPAQKEPANA